VPKASIRNGSQKILDDGMGGEMPSWNALYASGSVRKSFPLERKVIARILPAADSDDAIGLLYILAGKRKREMETIDVIRRIE
jgi:hypothetical protein